MEAQIGETTLDGGTDLAVAAAPNLHHSAPDEQPFQSSTFALAASDLLEPRVGQPNLDRPVMDSDVTGRVVVIVVLGQRGRGIAEVDKTIRNLGFEILRQPCERQSVGHCKRAAAVLRGVGRLSAGGRHGHPKTPNLLLDKRDVIARAGKVGVEKLRPGQRQNSESVRETAGRVDRGEATVEANEVAPARGDAGRGLPILFRGGFDEPLQLLRVGGQRPLKPFRVMPTRPTMMLLGKPTKTRLVLGDIARAVEIFEEASAAGGRRNIGQAIYIGGVELEF